MGVGDGLYMYDVVVKKFTFAISSPDEFFTTSVQEAQLSLRDRATRACQLKSGKVLHKCRRLVFEKL